MPLSSYFGFLYAIFRREALMRPRQKLFHLKRVALIAFISFVFVVTVLINFTNIGNALGLKLFTGISTILLFIIPLLSAPAAAMALYHERRSKALLMLSISDMPLPIFFVGRVIIHLSETIVAVLSCLPLVVLSLVFGGLLPTQIAASLAIMFVTFLFSIGYGIFLGSFMKSERYLKMFTILGMVFLVIILPIILSVMQLPRSYS